MCPGRDLNSHGVTHTPLKRTCLPDSTTRALHHGFPATAAIGYFPPEGGGVAGVPLVGAPVAGALGAGAEPAGVWPAG